MGRLSRRRHWRTHHRIEATVHHLLHLLHHWVVVEVHAGEIHVVVIERLLPGILSNARIFLKRLDLAMTICLLLLIIGFKILGGCVIRVVMIRLNLYLDVIVAGVDLI